MAGLSSPKGTIPVRVGTLPHRSSSKMSSFSLLNLNIMHGRNRQSAIFPLYLSCQEVQNNLDKIAASIRRHSPDIVTLQEVDQFSVLSGGFNQFDFLSTKLGYPYKYFAPSCSARFLGKSIFVSGEAIFSKYPLENCESFKFDFSFPTERKGFVVADVRLPEGKILTIVSVHLVWIDWLRLNSRSRQLDLLRQVV